MIANKSPDEIDGTKPQAAWNDANLTNPHEVTDKRQRVQKMFAAIAPSYDLNNRLHSLWQDQRWRRKAVELAALKALDRIVDVACGTGDLTVAFAQHLWHLHFEWETREGKYPAIEKPPVVGIDFTYEMLPLARPKGHFGICGADEEHGLGDGDYDGIRWINGDAQSLPLPEQSADVISIAFGIRNVQDPFIAIKEFYRVLRPGGRVIILEFFVADESDSPRPIQLLFPSSPPAHGDMDQRRQDWGLQIFAAECEHLHRPGPDDGDDARCGVRTRQAIPNDLRRLRLLPGFQAALTPTGPPNPRYSGERVRERGGANSKFGRQPAARANATNALVPHPLPGVPERGRGTSLLISHFDRCVAALPVYGESA